MFIAIIFYKIFKIKNKILAEINKSIKKNKLDFKIKKNRIFRGSI